MKITTCDICKKKIKEDAKSVHVGIGSSMFSNHLEICLDCGAPILKLLKAKKMINNENKKI